MSGPNPFFSSDYKEDGTKKGKFHPIVEVSLDVQGTPKVIMAYADTGCTAALAITKNVADRIGLGDESQIGEETEATLADGTLVSCIVHMVEGQIAGKKRSITLLVVNPDKKLGKSENPESILLGRGFFDYYDTLFQGTSNPKKLVFSE